MRHLEQVQEVLADLRFHNWRFVAHDRIGMVYIKAVWDAPCNVTGKLEEQVSRRWLIRPFASPMEIIQTAFKLVLTALEHEAREQFAYKDRAVLGPHPDLDALYSMAETVPPYTGGA